VPGAKPTSRGGGPSTVIIRGIWAHFLPSMFGRVAGRLRPCRCREGM
jgi:hypothetical protein